MERPNSKTIRQEPTHDMIEAAYTVLTTRPTDTAARARRAAREVWLQMWAAAPVRHTNILTRKQSQVHHVIAQYIADNGKSPQYKEIIAATDVHDSGHLRIILNALEKMRIISRPHPMRNRGIVLLVQPGEPNPNPLKNQNRGKKK